MQKFAARDPLHREVRTPRSPGAAAIWEKTTPNHPNQVYERLAIRHSMPFHGVFLARIQLSQLLDRGETWPSFRTDRWGNATGRVHRCGPHFLCLPFLGCVKAINLPPRHEYLPWGQRPLGCTQINYRNSMKFTCLVGAVQIYQGNRKNDGQVREINTSQRRRGNNLKNKLIIILGNRCSPSRKTINHVGLVGHFTSL